MHFLLQNLPSHYVARLQVVPSCTSWESVLRYFPKSQSNHYNFNDINNSQISTVLGHPSIMAKEMLSKESVIFFYPLHCTFTHHTMPALHSFRKNIDDASHFQNGAKEIPHINTLGLNSMVRLDLEGTQLITWTVAI